MGEHRRGYRGNFWTAEEVDQLTKLDARGCSPRDMAKAFGRTVSSIEGKLRSVRATAEFGELLGPGLARYEAPQFHENDDRKHLRALYDANGYGFGWWPPSLMERVYLTERAPAAGRSFWNAK